MYKIGTFSGPKFGTLYIFQVKIHLFPKQISILEHIAMKYGTSKQYRDFLGPFKEPGPNWDQVPNLGPLYEHCIVYLFGRGLRLLGSKIYYLFP